MAGPFESILDNLKSRQRLENGGEVKSKMARFGNVGYKFRKEVPSVTKLKEILNNLEPGQEITKSELSRLSGANRKTVSNVLQKDFPNLNIGEGSKINIKRLNEIKKK
jgi:hypothetical protein